MRTTVRLDEDLLRRAKMRAAAEGTTLTALIERGLEAILNGASPPMSGMQEEGAMFERERNEAGTAPTGRDFLSGLPRDYGPSLLESQEYMRLADKAGSALPSHILAVLDEEAALERLRRSAPDT